LNVEAERVLYHTFTRKSQRSLLLFFRRVSDCKRVAQLVFKLTISIGSELDRQFWDLMKLALLAMTNLKVFHFRDFGGVGGISAASILRKCTFQLLEFHWDSTFNVVDLFLFLAGQKEVEAMKLIVWESTGPFPEFAMPYLRYLAGSYVTIRGVLLGRQVMHLCWYTNLDDPLQIEESAPEDGSPFAEALKNICVLVQIGPYKSLAPFAKHLSNLQILEFEGEPDKLGSIPHLPNLEEIEMHSISDMQISVVREKTRKLFDSMPALRSISIETLETGMYSRWTRNSREPHTLTRTRTYWREYFAHGRGRTFH
jgi:hypothetical protein